MSLFKASWAISFTFSLLAFALSTNGFLTDFLNSTSPVSPPASKMSVNNTSVSHGGSPFLNANVTNPALASMLSSISEAESVAEACYSVVAALGTPVVNVHCATSTTSDCDTYTSYNFPESVYPPTSCCDACSIQASRVQINYWAPETDSPGTATTLNSETPYTLVSDGYTFTSPSVYVVFKDLYAQGECTYYGEGQIGNNISDATIAYDPDALSTAECDIQGEGSFEGYKPINYSSWYYPLPNSVVETQTGCHLLVTDTIDPAGTDLVESPMFMMPQGLSSLEPIWSSYGCQANGRNPAFDPPRVLTKTGALGPGIQDPSSQSATITPAAQLSPPTVTPTTTSRAQPTLEAGTPDPKSVGADPKEGGLVPEPAISDQHPTPTSQDAMPTPTSTPSDPKETDSETPDYPAGDSSGRPEAPVTPPAVYLQANGITQGAPSVTRNGQALAYKSGSIYIGASVVPVPSVNKQHATTFVAAGLTFSVKPADPQDDTMPTLTIGTNVITANSASQYLVGSQTLMVGSPAITLSGTVISLGAGESELVIGTSREKPALGSLIMLGFGGPPQLSQVVTQGLTFSEDASEAIISGTTYFLESAASKIIKIGSQTLVLGPAGTIQPSTPSPITLDGITFAADASQAIIGGMTYSINSNSPSSTVEYNGRIFYLGSGGVQLAPTLSAITEGSLTLSLDATEAVIEGTTYPVGQGASPTAIVVGDETLSLGPNGVGIPSVTIAPPDIKGTLSALTIGGLTLSLDATEAVMQGTTYPIGLGATLTTVVVGTETLRLGPGGVGLPPTTISPPTPIGTLTSLTMDGLTLSLDSTEAVIDGTTYPIGPGASATTVVVGEETLSLGPGGIGFPSTTIAPPDSNSTSNNFQVFTGAGGLSSEALGSFLNARIVVLITIMLLC